MTRLLIRGGIVVDGIGHEPHPADVVLEHGRIVAVGPGLDGDTEIDASGHTVYPGFIDCHVHFMVDGNLDPMLSVQTPFSLNFFLAAERMGRTLATGVTTVREAGGSDLGVKHAQQRGLAAGFHRNKLHSPAGWAGYCVSGTLLARTCPGRSGSATRASRTTSSMAPRRCARKCANSSAPGPT